MLFEIQSRVRTIAENYLAAVALYVPGYLLITHHPFFGQFFNELSRVVLDYVLYLYLVVLPAYYWTLPAQVVPKSRLVWGAVRAVFFRKLTNAEKVALRAFVVKLFFLPLMIHWLVTHSQAIFYYGSRFVADPHFFPDGYWTLFNIIFWIDVACFTVGYAVEHPNLDNEIRSVEPTATGWIVTLICYPPFNRATETILGWYSSDFPMAGNLALQYALAAGMLIAFAVYAWASIALNLKASNLTHRGIVDRGPYAYIRHPAYVAKNLAWWLGGLPILVTQWSMGVDHFVYAVIGLAGWTMIYYLRAVTEERHLGMDPAFQAYCQRVPYRFVPGAW